MLKQFLVRIGLAAAVVTATLIAAPAAEAKVSIGIWIGPGPVSHWYGPGYYNGFYRRWVTCQQGAWIVAQRGYHRIRFVDCAPRFYLYRATRYDGRRYIIRLDSHWGTIVGRTRD